MITRFSGSKLSSSKNYRSMMAGEVPPKAAGGQVFQSGGYWYHVFTSSGTFTPAVGSLTVDYMIVAGGGAGGSGGSAGPGGGGGGGFRAFTGVTISAPSDAVIGAGGARYYNGVGSNGTNTSFNGNSVTGGGGGGVANQNRSGGSGGGASSNAGNPGGPGNAGGYTPVEGYRGGNGGINGGGGGGGGAGGQGGDGYSGPVAGGPGATVYNGIDVSSWLTVTGSPSSLGYGGMGAVSSTTPGAANSGGGGAAGGGYISGGGGSGGSGLVIVRYKG